MRSSVVFASLLCAVAAVGCGGGGQGGGGGTCDATQYPCGPYGYAAGSVIENLTVSGRRDINKNGQVLSNPVMPIKLADYHLDPNLKALVISIAATWCVPCVNEQPALAQTYRDYLAAGAHVAILESIVQDQGGQPANQNTVDAWTMAYKTPFDMAADLMGALAPYYDPHTFPTQMVVRTSTMSITYYNVGGANDAELKAAIDQAMAN